MAFENHNPEHPEQPKNPEELEQGKKNPELEQKVAEERGGELYESGKLPRGEKREGDQPRDPEQGKKSRVEKPETDAPENEHPEQEQSENPEKKEPPEEARDLRGEDVDGIHRLPKEEVQTERNNPDEAGKEPVTEHPEGKEEDVSNPERENQADVKTKGSAESSPERSKEEERRQHVEARDSLGDPLKKSEDSEVLKGTDTQPNEKSVESSKEAKETKPEEQNNHPETKSEQPHGKRFEDLSASEMKQMEQDDPAKLQGLNRDYQERWSAEARGMTQEEYQNYKQRLAAQNEKEQENDTETEKRPEPASFYNEQGSTFENVQPLNDEREQEKSVPEYKTQEYESNNLRTGESLNDHHPAEISNEIKDSLQSFEPENWNRMSPEEQKEAVYQLRDTIADELNIKDRPDVKFYNNEDQTDFGGYSPSENAIYLNEYHMEDSAETADTIAHESRHCWQHERANLPEEEQTEQDKAFKESFENYIGPNDDYQEYKKLAVELDARKYAETITNRVHENEDTSNGKSDDISNGHAPEFKELSPEKGAVFDKVDLPNDLTHKSVDRVPVSDEVKKSLEGSGLTDTEIQRIRELPKPDYKHGEVLDRNIHKPDPKTYLNQEYIDKHLEPFEKTGCYRIQADNPMLPDDIYNGVVGHHSGLFVTSGKDMCDALEKANGDVTKLEEIFAMPNGSWGDAPVIIRINDPQNLRMPDGNELGAWPEYYIPGGFTAGNKAEAVIDSVPRGEYEVKPFIDKDLLEWIKDNEEVI